MNPLAELLGMEEECPTQKCRRCGVLKPFNAYEINSYGSQRFPRKICKECRDTQQDSKKVAIIKKWGTVKINYQSMMTNIEGVFAAGDIVRGASLVVWGIKDGRDVAKKIEDFLVNKEKNTDKSKYQKKDLAYA